MRDLDFNRTVLGVTGIRGFHRGPWPWSQWHCPECGGRSDLTEKDGLISDGVAMLWECRVCGLKGGRIREALKGYGGGEL